jgi:hypothetical protein
MSARAASRLESLGFTVYRYQPGKADWFAAGLPREGKEASISRVADVAERDVTTCRLYQRVGDLPDRTRPEGLDVCVVVDAERVVLGLIEAEGLKVDPATSVEEIMQPAPLTFRPNVQTGEIPEYVKSQHVRHVLVTTSDGVLIGLLRPHAASSVSLGTVNLGSLAANLRRSLRDGAPRYWPRRMWGSPR